MGQFFQFAGSRDTISEVDVEPGASGVPVIDVDVGAVVSPFMGVNGREEVAEATSLFLLS